MLIAENADERRVLDHILFAEGNGKAWAVFAGNAQRDAALALAERGVVVCAYDGRDFLARRANGVRIEGVA